VLFQHVCESFGFFGRPVPEKGFLQASVLELSFWVAVFFFLPVPVPGVLWGVLTVVQQTLQLVQK